MDWIFKSQNFMALISVPIAISTIISVRKSWTVLWDGKLTSADRSLLMRIALFIIMPIIVLFHECGHAAATILCGGQVAEFYYGFLWGYVVPRGNFTELQILWIYLAGNLVEIALGLVALLVAIFATAPAVVALAVYVAFWAVGGTLIFYTLLSVIGAYGDWQAIYTSPLRNEVHMIGVLHGVAVALIIWAAYSKTAALWFARKTNPSMVPKENELLQNAQAGGANELLQLAWFYYQVGVNKVARKYLKDIEKQSANLPEAILLLGWITYAENNYKEAQRIFISCAQNEQSEPVLQARAYMGAADSQVQLVGARLRGGEGSGQDWSEAVSLLSKAHDIAPDMGDPLFYRADLFMKQHLYNRAEHDLRDLLQLRCLDSNLFERAQVKLAAFTAAAKTEQ